MQISDEDILKILASIRNDLSTLTVTVDHRLNKLDLELHGYRTAMKVLRWIGAVILAVVTLRFGDIQKLFS